MHDHGLVAFACEQLHTITSQFAAQYNSLTKLGQAVEFAVTMRDMLESMEHLLPLITTLADASTVIPHGGRKECRSLLLRPKVIHSLVRVVGLRPAAVTFASQAQEQSVRECVHTALRALSELCTPAATSSAMVSGGGGGGGGASEAAPLVIDALVSEYDLGRPSKCARSTTGGGALAPLLDIVRACRNKNTQHTDASRLLAVVARFGAAHFPNHLELLQQFLDLGTGRDMGALGAESPMDPKPRKKQRAAKHPKRLLSQSLGLPLS
jgi:hypothetical protein